MTNQPYRTGAAATDFLQRGRSQFEDVVVLVTSTIHGMWRYRWLALSLAWAVSVVGWLYVYSMPNVYQANTRIFVDAESMIKRLVGDLTLGQDVTTEINVLTRVLLSQPQLEKTARMTGLDVYATTPREHERLIENLRNHIRLYRESGGDNIFGISFQSSSRDTAEAVVSTLLDNFKEDALGERRTDSAGAQEFLEAQIREYERRLGEAEKRLADFKRDNIGLMPGETGDYYTRLQATLKKVDTLRGDLKLAEERRDEYRNQLRGEEPVFGLGAGPAQEVRSSFDASIAQYEASLNELLLKYTPNHPDVIALRETIDRLKGQRAEEISKAGPVRTKEEPLDTNPVYQRMKIGLAEAEIEVVTLKSKLATAEADYKGLEQKTNTIPDVERQLTALNRDYTVTQQQYDTLLQRRESLHITGQVEQSGDQLQFRTIDPPRALLTPVGPDRPMLLAGVAVFAIGLGGALAFLLHQLNPVFTDRRHLREIAGLPVLGTVSYLLTPEGRTKSRHRKVVFAAASAGLPIALAVALVLQEQLHRAVEVLLGVLGS